MQFIFRVVTAAASMFMLTACRAPERPPLKAAFQDLTSETSQPRGSLLNHNEVMSVAGWIPLGSPGTLLHFSDPGDPTTAIGLSLSDKSRIITLTFGNALNQGNTQEIIAIRDALRNYQRAQIELFICIDQAIAECVSALSLVTSSPSPSDRQPNELAADALRKVFEDYTRTMSQRRAAVFDAETELVKTVNRPGLVLTQWSNLTDAFADVSAPGFGRASARRQTRADGYWILDGLRVEYILFAKDAFEWDNPKPTEWKEIAKYLPALSVATMTLQAQRSLWVSESAELLAVRGKVQASVAQLVATYSSFDIAAGILGRLHVDVEYAIASRANLSNIGFLGDAVWDSRPVQWQQTGLQPPSNGWQTIMVQSASLGRGSDSTLRAFKNLKEMSQAAEPSMK